MSQLRKMKRQQQTADTLKRVKTAKESFEEGFKKGLNKGFIQGFKEGNAETVNRFCDAMETLKEVPGIGPKRFNAILKHLGYDSAKDLSKEERWKP